MFDFENETINSKEIKIEPFWLDLIEYLTGEYLSDDEIEEDTDKSIDIGPLDIAPF